MDVGTVGANQLLERNGRLLYKNCRQETWGKPCFSGEVWPEAHTNCMTLDRQPLTEPGSNSSPDFPLFALFAFCEAL